MGTGQPFYNHSNMPYNTQNFTYTPNYPQYDNLYSQPQQIRQSTNLSATGQYTGQMQQQIAPRTNMPLATSLMDAMSRNNEPNTDFYYADQDNPYIYKIAIDMQGRKTYRTFKIEDVTDAVAKEPSDLTGSIDLSVYAKKEDLQALKEEMTAMASSFMAQNVSPAARAKSTERVVKTDKE